MEMINKNTKLYSWQIKALSKMSSRNKSNQSREMRKALSKYIEQFYLKKITRQQEDILHFKARNKFEKSK